MAKDYMKSGEIRQGDSLHFDGKGFYTRNKKLTLWQRFREFMGWHKPTSGTYQHDGASMHSICQYCGKDIMQDSQGGWF